MINVACNSCLEGGVNHVAPFAVCQVSMKEHVADSLLECTMQDLLRYDDYNNDGHLSLHEFYTAFREFQVAVFPSAQAGDLSAEPVLQRVLQPQKNT